MLSNLLELAGFALLVLFAFVVWPPAALAVAGLGLILASYLMDRPEKDVPG